MSSSFFDTSKYVDLDFGKKYNLNLSSLAKKEEDKNPFDMSKDKSPFTLGDLYDSDIPKSFVDKIGAGDGKGFLDKQLGNYKAYLEATKEDKSDEDKDRDLIRELAGKNNLSTVLGDMGKGFSTEVAQGLTAYNPPSPNQQMFIPGQEATGKSLGQRFAGGIAGLGKGLMTGVPHGGAFGFASGFLG